MFNPLILPELREMLSTGDAQGLSEVMNELHPATIADFSEGLTVEETWQMLGPCIGRQASGSLLVLSAAQTGRDGQRRGPGADVEVARGDVRLTTASTS